MKRMITFSKYFLALSLGLAIGYVIPFSEEKLGQLSSVASILGGISTCIAAFAAVAAINSWREQFTHSEKVRLLNNLEDSFTNLHITLGDYRQNRIKVVKTEVSLKDLSYLPELKSSEQESYSAYETAFNTYFKNYERLSRIIDLSTCEVISPDEIQNKIINLLQGIPAIYKASDLDKSVHLLDSNWTLLSELWIDTKFGFKSIRHKC